MKKQLIFFGSFFTAALVIFIIFCALIYKSGGEPLGVDASIRDFAYQIRGKKYGFWFWVCRILTEFGYTYFMIVLVLATLIYTRLDYRFLCLGIGILLQLILNKIFKGIYQRERPFQEMWWMYEGSKSFPSGHSTTAGMAYSYLIYEFATGDYKKKIRVIGIVISACFLFIIPFTRIMLGMHYFSDCLAGIALGSMVAILMMLVSLLCKEYGILTKGVIHFKKKEQ